MRNLATPLLLTFAAHNGALAAQADPNTDQRWSMGVRMLATQRSDEGYIMAVGAVTLIEPNGIKHHFMFRSGGHGDYGDQSMLPGLNHDYTGPDDHINALYLIDWSKFNHDTIYLPREMKGPNRKGSWISIHPADPEMTERGTILGAEGEAALGAFGIHTDGSNVGDYNAPNDGTHGCIGIVAEQSEDFFTLLDSLSGREKPLKLTVWSHEEDVVASLPQPGMMR